MRITTLAAHQMRPPTTSQMRIFMSSLPSCLLCWEPAPRRVPWSVRFHRNGGMQLLLLRYTQALITQMAQTGVCNRHHSVDQQLCRWLLLSLDRLSSNQLVMTQELIANMLGVRREGVTEAAGKLQKLGVIRYARGKITVLDRPKLEKLCCECYAVVKKECDRLIPRTMTQVDLAVGA